MTTPITAMIRKTHVCFPKDTEGSVWKHHRGDYYTIVAVSQDEEDRETQRVNYRQIQTQDWEMYRRVVPVNAPIYSMPVSAWTRVENDGSGAGAVERFAIVHGSFW